MNKKFLLSFIFIGILFFTGCFKNGSKDIVATLTKKVEKADSYHIEGLLEINNNENIYKYDVDVSYMKDEKFRVSLKNKTNQHEQIILKNSEGVFVLTPSLNKSFKFQSEWPYNNSQSYLLQTILEDIKNDSEKKVEQKEDNYIITTKVNYSNNKNLVNQKIYLKKDGTITKVEVLNKEGTVKMKMTYSKVDMKANFDKNYFDLAQNMSLNDKTSVTMNSIEDIVYPMYMPENTYLQSEETVSLDSGERVILTFEGEKPFMLVEETVSVDNENSTIPVYGELAFLNDTIGSISDGTATWISDGIEYYAVSETLDQNELLEIVNSISVIPVGK